MPRLGVNIDHVATLRNARGGIHPCPLRAAEVVKRCGAEILTIHLREDRRHIRDKDVETIIGVGLLPVNLEMAATDEMLALALKYHPYAVCIVPERREEVTTEGGLNVLANCAEIERIVRVCNDAGIRSSLFIDPDIAQVEAAARVGAKCVELHTGAYAGHKDNRNAELQKVQIAAKRAHALGLEVHAGHGLDFENVAQVAAIEEIVELNIGHFLVGEAIFIGLEAAILQMKARMVEARGGK